MTVEHQIAILFCGTRGLLQKVPVNRIHDFELEYLHQLDERYGEILTKLKAGQLTDEITSTLETLAQEVSRKYEK